ncbi:MAG TPA: ATPase [Bacillota bacterium]|nr:ATPase [Candidatus Fermentithermobacillaceae bacterium]HOB30085.1 ATPase [Bacillota bacterium]HOK63975.1 ATPase [Bacillota bacterium]HOQ02459.1 ATPase [Bacillota bacterium]HPP60184.1 ATPase [Bacillota bacterium]
MDVLIMIERLDTYLSECSRLPLVGKLLVDEDEVFDMIDEIKAAIPPELEQARWLLKERERILQEARKEADQIISDAKGQIDILASESIIAKEARKQAEDLLERTQEVATEIHVGAREYADEIMERVENLLANLLEEVRQNRQELGVTVTDVSELEDLEEADVKMSMSSEDLWDFDSFEE